MGDETTDGWTFTCYTCGGKRIEVNYRETQVQHCRSTLPCTCGEREHPDGLAAERTWTNTVAAHDWGLLNETHHVDWAGQEIENVERGDDDAVQVFCGTCYDAADENDWTVEPLTDESIEQIDEEWAVSCADCHREIPFGWSHPDRGGRIWPAECSDHNPMKSWPEPRFQELWPA